jgi:hypothetical protein
LYCDIWRYFELADGFDDTLQGLTKFRYLVIPEWQCLQSAWCERPKWLALLPIGAMLGRDKMREDADANDNEGPWAVSGAVRG